MRLDRDDPAAAVAHGDGVGSGWLSMMRQPAAGIRDGATVRDLLLPISAPGPAGRGSRRCRGAALMGSRASIRGAPACQDREQAVPGGPP
jgi:hypothetical protein